MSDVVVEHPGASGGEMSESAGKGSVEPRRRTSMPVDRVAWLFVALPTVVALLGAWSYRWVDEDAFIDFRVVANLIAGHGPVFNVGERVEADSNPLWMALLAVLHVMTPFLSLEWLSVILGLACTVVAFVVGGRAIQRLAYGRSNGRVFPLGLLMVSSVAGLWEFATSGLEMSLVFVWLSVCFFGLVVVAERRRAPVTTAVVMGLGGLIRPELVLASAVFLAALFTVALAAGWQGRHGVVRRIGSILLGAAALPVGYQVFRMSYYALLVPNTGLAKAAGAAWWSQGWTYVVNMVEPYGLWIPVLLVLPLLLGRVRTWWSDGDRVGVTVLLAPWAVSAVDILYVAHVGGDYMHARLLLPALFSLGLPVFVAASEWRRLGGLLSLGVIVWAVVCIGWLRFVPPHLTNLTPQTIFISNERNSWISATGNPHPITAADYHAALSGKAGTQLATMANEVPHGEQRLLVVTDPFAPVAAASPGRAYSTLPFTLAVNLPAIGVIGYLAGPKVYVFDAFSLANPIGSHTVIVHHARPGHEKYIGPAWMVARFGRGTLPVGVTHSEVAAARAALSCGSLRPYLAAITGAWTPARAWSNLVHAWGFTTLSFSANPLIAERQLCVAPENHHDE